MARGKAWNQKERDELLHLYAEGKSFKEIGLKLGRPAGSVKEFIYREKLHGGGVLLPCEFCGKTIKVAEAVFCPYCGKKILTEKDRVMEHLNDIGKCIGEFPNSFRDRIMANVNEIRKYIKGH